VIEHLPAIHRTGKKVIDIQNLSPGDYGTLPWGRVKKAASLTPPSLYRIRAFSFRRFHREVPFMLTVENHVWDHFSSGETEALLSEVPGSGSPGGCWRGCL
jgi:hypothetical protein